MATTQANPQERIARERLTQRPLFLGVDGAGAAHYWDGYESAVVVVDGEDDEKIELDQTPLATLREWCEYTRGERGWEVGPRVGGSVVDDLRRMVDV